MEQTITYRPNTWIREAPAITTEGPRVAFALFVLFLMMIYSCIAVVYKAQLDAYRPTLLIALAALFMMVVELGSARRSFRLMWPQGILLVVLLGVCVVSTFNAIYVSHALEQTADFSKMVLIYLLIENVVTNEHRLKTVMLAMVIGGLFPAIGTILNYQAGILQENSRASWRGIFKNPNEAAYAMLILIPIAIALARLSNPIVRAALWAAVAVYLLAIFLTFSRGGFVALFVVAGVMGWKHKSIAIKAGMIAALLAGAVFIGMFWKRSSGDFTNIKEDTSFRQRMATFEAGGLMFLNNPLLGVGPGDSMVAYPLYVPIAAHCGCQDQLVVHNSFIQALAELGVLGFSAFVLFIGFVMYQAWKMERGPLSPYATALSLAMVGFLMCSMSGGFVYTWWPYILAGLITATKHIANSRAADVV